MFRRSSKQSSLFEASTLLSPQRKQRLEDGWAGWFRRVALPILEREEPRFSVLYSSEGRPNYSVVQLLGISLLQNLHDLPDQAALDQYSFDQRWQHALGVGCDEADATRRTLVEFRRRLVAMDPEGELLRIVFDAIFDAGAKDLDISTAQQRLDSTLVCSNIRRRGRLSLGRETLRLFLRSLGAEKRRAVSKAILDWYQNVTEQSGWDDDKRGDVKASQLVQWLAELEHQFAEDPTVSSSEPYQLLLRMLREHGPRLSVEEEVTEADTSSDDEAAAAEQDSSSDDDPPSASPPTAAKRTQKNKRKRKRRAQKGKKSRPKQKAAHFWSAHDPDASFSHKGLGYHAHLTETCRNETTELLTHYDVVTAAENDKSVLEKVVDHLKGRGNAPDQLYADGGYASARNLRDCNDQGIDLRTPVHRGTAASDALSRADFAIDGDNIRCPAGHAPVRIGTRKSRHIRREDSPHAFFSSSQCANCPNRKRCPVLAPKNQSSTDYFIDLHPALIRRDRRWADQKEPAFWKDYQIRAGVEATVSEAKRAHGMARLRYRGMSRVRLAIAFKATAMNLKRWGRAARRRRADASALILQLLRLVPRAAPALAA